MLNIGKDMIEANTFNYSYLFLIKSNKMIVQNSSQRGAVFLIVNERLK